MPTTSFQVITQMPTICVRLPLRISRKHLMNVPFSGVAWILSITLYTLAYILAVPIEILHSSSTSKTVLECQGAGQRLFRCFSAPWFTGVCASAVVCKFQQLFFDCLLVARCHGISLHHQHPAKPGLI